MAKHIERATLDQLDRLNGQAAVAVIFDRDRQALTALQVEASVIYIPLKQQVPELPLELDKRAGVGQRTPMLANDRSVGEFLLRPVLVIH